MPTPCPCMSLQTGVKIIAVLASIGSIVNIVVGSIEIADIISEYDNNGTINGTKPDDNHNHEDSKAILVGAFAVFMIAMVIGLILNIFLWFGAVHRNPGYCLGWLIVTVIILCLSVFQVIRGQPVVIVNFIVRFYYFWVVFAFRREIKNEIATGAAYGYGGRTISNPTL